MLLQMQSFYLPTSIIADARFLRFLGLINYLYQTWSSVQSCRCNYFFSLKDPLGFTTSGNLGIYYDETEMFLILFFFQSQRSILLFILVRVLSMKF
jgi:hypothetical protein